MLKLNSKLTVLIIFLLTAGQIGALDNTGEKTENLEKETEEVVIKKIDTEKARGELQLLQGELDYQTEKELHLENPWTMDLKNKSYASGEKLQAALEDSLLEPLAGAYVKAEEKYGVNAIFLAALSIHESGWGTSNITRQKNNLFGFGAYDHSPFDSAVGFDSRTESIEAAARLLSNDYLSEDGRYYQGGYTLSHVGVNYASCLTWPDKVARVMQMLQKEIERHDNSEYNKTR